MDDTWKTLALSLVKSIVDRAVMASGLALAANGWFDQAQTANYDQVASGVVMIFIGAGIGWYRDHGKALLKAQVDKLNAQIDAMTKNIEQGTVTITHPSGSKISLDRGSVNIESNGSVSLSGSQQKT